MNQKAAAQDSDDPDVYDGEYEEEHSSETKYEEKNQKMLVKYKNSKRDTYINSRNSVKSLGENSAKFIGNIRSRVTKAYHQKFKSEYSYGHLDIVL
ncbi:hypothetical protein Ciccas_012630 [Cichlidogyrus casuarinus]|uniref:Uncharacterized protein n=1 Tax=Cichlidogyrus casuarinus TaxID=1844966 RepID=A0ABD2PMV7_9PLAT